MENQKCEILTKLTKLNSVRTPSFRTPRNEIALASFVNISPTLVIDMSMERSSGVLLHGNQKI